MMFPETIAPTHVFQSLSLPSHPGFGVVTQLEWGVDVEVAVDEVVKYCVDDLKVSVAALAGKDALPPTLVVKVEAPNPVLVNKLSVFIVVTGHRPLNPDQDPVLRWSAQLTPTAHDERVYDTAVKGRALHMDCDGEFDATAFYRRCPPAWTGAELTATSPNIERYMRQ
jgi:hypothetical protein